MRVFRCRQVPQILIQADLPPWLGVDVHGRLKALHAPIGDHLVHRLVLERLVVLERVRVVVVDIVEEKHAAALVALVRVLRWYYLLERLLEALG